MGVGWGGGLSVETLIPDVQYDVTNLYYIINNGKRRVLHYIST